MQKRATMLAATARMLPVPISLLLRLREVSFFMYTISGAAAMRHVITGGYAQAHAPFGYKQASALKGGCGCVRQRGGCAPANMEKKEEKKPHHETWKARECGLLVSRMTNWVALCSASTCTRTVDTTVR